MELPESENYITTIGYSEEFKRDCYLLTNKRTGVVEMETTVFSYARGGIEQLEQSLSGDGLVDSEQILQ